ncbi:MAG: branched-chain amino acid ABC transporter permease, partial [Euryarchaeota archaeon]|nr:branched-chain amino acid ABC transporter permease [Euryarchaeota archaeon]
MRPLPRHATDDRWGRWTRSRLIVVLFTVPILTALAVTAEAQDDPESVDLFFRRITTVVWGNGTTYNEFHVDAKAGDAVNLTVAVGVTRNRLVAEHEASLRVRFSGNDTDEILAEEPFLVGPNSGSTIVLAGVNLTIPLDAEGRYTFRFTLDAGGLDPNLASNERSVPVQVGEAGVLDRLLGTFAARMLSIFVLAALTVAAIAWVIVARTPKFQERREKWRLHWESFLVWWLHHPNHARNKALLASATVVLIVLWLVTSEHFRTPTTDGLLRQALVGLRIGALYALIAIGYTMVYGVLKFINFAHGEIFMWGAYFLFFLSVDQSWMLIVAAFGAILLAGALGFAIERVAYRPLRGRPRLTPLITAIGVSLFLQAAAQLFFGTAPRGMGAALRGTTMGGRPLDEVLATEVFRLFGVPFSVLSLLILGLSVVLMVALHLFVRYSRFGKAMRAVADDMETASIIGINTDRVVSMTFIIGSMLAAVAGILFAIRFTISPTTGLLPGIKAFTAAVVGGIGNIYGA